MWGMNVSALKMLVDHFDPILITAFRILVSGLAVLIAAAFLGIFRFPLKSEWWVIFSISLFNVILHHGLVAIGLETTSAINGGLILGMVPLITMVMAGIMLKQFVSNWKILGFIIGFIGVVITTSVGDEGYSTVSIGDVLVFLGVVVQGLSFVLISKLKPTFDPRLFTGYMMVVGAICLIIYSKLVNKDFTALVHLFDWKMASIFIFSAVFATAFGHMTYNFAIKKVGPAESAIFINLNTLFALLGASVFLGEIINVYHIAGFIFILVGVFFGTGASETVYKKFTRRQQ